MKVGAILKAARQRAGLTLSEVAAQIGSSASTLSAVENDLHKNPLTPAEMVGISDVIMDRVMLREYCDACPIRSRILVRKFPGLNQIVPGAIPATLKVIEKLADAADTLQPMLSKMLNRNFAQDPEFIDYRNGALLKVLDLKRGAEILMDQFQEQGIVTAEELRMLRDMQQRLCEAKGHHVPEEG
jgi:DNA-binding XRE family transcriptional regulator